MPVSVTILILTALLAVLTGNAESVDMCNGTVKGGVVAEELSDECSEICKKTRILRHRSPRDRDDHTQFNINKWPALVTLIRCPAPASASVRRACAAPCVRTPNTPRCSTISRKRATRALMCRLHQQKPSQCTTLRSSCCPVPLYSDYGVLCSRAGAPPGASPDAPRARRPCPSGADCQLRHIARHEELFTHAVAAAAPGDEAGAPAYAPAPAPVPAAVATQSEEWTCGACTFRNAANRNSCEMCTSPKPSVDEMGPG